MMKFFVGWVGEDEIKRNCKNVGLSLLSLYKIKEYVMIIVLEEKNFNKIECIARDVIVHFAFIMILS